MSEPAGSHERHRRSHEPEGSHERERHHGRRSYERGVWAELRVRTHLEGRGYRILDTNVRLAGGELDIVARRGRQLLFCEVRMRSRSDFGDALETVDFVKARRIRKAAQMWIACHPGVRRLDVSLEVAAVRPDGIELVTFE